MANIIKQKNEAFIKRSLAGKGGQSIVKAAKVPEEGQEEKKGLFINPYLVGFFLFVLLGSTLAGILTNSL
jgi:hypothetical protein